MKNHELKKIFSKLGKNNIVLIGHMGSGKSIIGKIIAKKFGFKHFDSDIEISKYTKKTINQIFAENGEGHFRKIEKEIVLKLIEKKNIILSLGGGSILNRQVRDKLKNESITLFLDVNINELEKRLKDSNKRPLLQGINIRKKIKNLDIDRRKYYLLADIKINNTHTSPYKNSRTFIEKFINLYEKIN
tara:strand:+ start:212 stop:775 length:564 start_codon:yes stop_codon:yes gene_type:complete